MDSDIAVLIPCYNEEKTINKVVSDFINALEGYDYKIYVYDNNSSDRTFEIANSINHNKVICKKESCRGKGFVVRRMFQDINANCYLLVDGDDTYSRNQAAEMVRYVIDENIDMVVGDRLSTTYHKENKRHFHSFGNILVSKLINTFFHSNIKDIMTGYRAFSKQFVKTSGILAQGFELETEMTILALEGNYKIKEIPVEYKDRIDGSYSKLNTYKDGFKVLKTIFILFKDYRPFEFFAFFAILLAIAFLALFIPIFFEYLKTGLVMRFPTLFMSIFFGILSILSASIGIILSTVTKIARRDKEVFKLNYK